MTHTDYLNYSENFSHISQIEKLIYYSKLREVY